MVVVWNLSIYLGTLLSICFYLCLDSYSVPDTQSVWQAAELLLSYWGYHCELRLMSQIATCRTPKCAVKACACVWARAWADASSSWIERNVIAPVPLSPNVRTITQTRAKSSVDQACCLHVSLIKYSIIQLHSSHLI